MKKRIISIILVAVMAILSLAGCAYNYEKDDMSKYATFDKDAFLAELQKLSFEDADFGFDENERLVKVQDAIIKTLAGLADKDDKIKTGVPSANDTLYYCYYVTTLVGEKTHTFYGSSMKESSAQSLQLGYSDLTDLNKAIAEALATFDFTDKAYSTTTSGVAEAGNKLNISYTEKYEVADEEDEDLKEKVSNSYTYVEIELPTEDNLSAEGADKSFAEQLIGKTVGTTLSGDIIAKVDGKTVTYTGVKINWIVNSGSSVEVENTYEKPEDSKEDATLTDAAGEKVKLTDLDGKTFTYHVFPVYYLAVEDALSATLILTKIFGSNISCSSLEMFEDEKYVFVDGDKSTKLEKLVDDLADIVKTNDTAEDAVETAQNKVEEAEEKVKEAEEKIEAAGGEASATAAMKTALKEAQDALKKAKEDLEKKEKDFKEAAEKLDKAVKNILSIDTKETDVTMESLIVDAYEESVYEQNEKTYLASVQENAAKAIIAAAKKYLKYNGTYPKRAMKEAYNRVENAYKNTFYNGTFDDGNTSTTDDVSNYSYYEGSYDKFIRAALKLDKDASNQAVKDAITKEAEATVKDAILIYTVAELFGAEVEVTKDDIKEFKQTNFLYMYYTAYQGEDVITDADIKIALQLDELMNYLVKVKEKEDLKDDATVEEITENNKVVFEHIKYTFTEEAAE